MQRVIASVGALLLLTSRAFAGSGDAGGNPGNELPPLVRSEPAPDVTSQPLAAQTYQAVTDPHWCDHGHLVGQGIGFCVLDDQDHSR